MSGAESSGSERTRGELWLLLATAIWGSTFPIGKVLLYQMDAVQMMLVRFGVATVVLLLLGWRSIFPLPRQVIRKGVVLGAFLGGGFIAQMKGLAITTASRSAFITGMSVAIVPLLQLAMERRAPRLGNALGILIASIGLWMMTSPESAPFNAGDALTVLCAVLFSAYIVYLDIVSHEVPTIRLLFLQFASTAVIALLWVVAAGHVSIHLDVRGYGALAFLTVFATLFTTYLQTRHQKTTTPTRAAVIFTVEPVIAAVIAALALGESLGAAGVVGGVLILVGVMVSEFSESIPLLKMSLASGRKA